MIWWKKAQVGDRIICRCAPDWSAQNEESLAEWCSMAPVPGEIYTIKDIVVDPGVGSGIGFELVERPEPDPDRRWVACATLFVPLDNNPLARIRKVKGYVD